MPLSKERNRERMRQARSYLVQPKPTAVQPKPTAVQPKHPLAFLYPDGRCRTPGMAVVQPSECEVVRMLS